MLLTHAVTAMWVVGNLSGTSVAAPDWLTWLTANILVSWAKIRPYEDCRSRAGLGGASLLSVINQGYKKRDRPALD